MKYLIEIRRKYGHSLPSLLITTSDVFDFADLSVSVYDSETQRIVDVDLDSQYDLHKVHKGWAGPLPSYSFAPVDAVSNCLGIASFYQGCFEYVAAAVYNKNTVKFYDYVESIDTQPIPPSGYVHDGSNIYYEMHHDKNVVLKTSTLTIMLSEYTRILGECGSVVARLCKNDLTLSHWNRAYTLYDFLLDLCRECFLNVMSYETIRLVDIHGSGVIMTIKLAHNTEAKSFFVEMYERSLDNSFKWYVSDIQVDGEQTDYATRPCVSNMVVTMKNMDTGVTEKISDFPIDDCYGFSPRQYNDNLFIVRHTKSASQLYKYIKFAKTYWEAPKISSDARVCYLGERAKFEPPPDPATKTLAIDVGLTSIYLYEPCGSVVYVRNWRDNFLKYLSLYDFLIFLCKLTHLNIMSYRIVHIFSTGVVGETEIIFDHEVEGADRFFLKMYMLKALE